MLRIKVPKLDRNLSEYIDNVKAMDPLGELKRDMGNFLSEIDITDNMLNTDNMQNTDKILNTDNMLNIDNMLNTSNIQNTINKQNTSNVLNTNNMNNKGKKSKEQVVDNIIDGIINSNM